ncbi:MAG: hypothetical protein LKK25_07700 [Sphaerochaeta sp.]|jgi:ABC-type proline/glycine betaine transport system substrate-binding protein|nr:hypothetical protein [Sphaerochaeta sp.]
MVRWIGQSKEVAMKKRLLWVMLGLLVTSMLFAAGANEKSVNEQTQNGPVNLVWAGWSGEEEATKDIFQKMRGCGQKVGQEWREEGVFKRTEKGSG